METIIELVQAILILNKTAVSEAHPYFSMSIHVLSKPWSFKQSELDIQHDWQLIFIIQVPDDYIAIWVK